MKKGFLIAIVIVLAVLCVSLSAQTIVSPDKAAALVTLDQQIAGLQVEVAQLSHFTTQSQRIAYYDALHRLAITQGTYYTLLAETDSERGYLAKQTAWQYKQKAAGLQNKLYSLACYTPPMVQPVGKLRF
jgi:hypothetical protein